MPKVVDHQERRIKLIEAMWRTIVRDGRDAATMSAIATGAGFATGPARVPLHQGGPAVGRLRPHLTRPAALRSCCLKILPLDATSRDEAVWSSRSERRLTNAGLAERHERATVSGEQRSSTSSPRPAKQAEIYTDLCDEQIIGHLLAALLGVADHPGRQRRARPPAAGCTWRSAWGCGRPCIWAM